MEAPFLCAPSLQVTSILGRQLKGVVGHRQKCSNPEMSDHFCCQHVVDLLQPWTTILPCSSLEYIIILSLQRIERNRWGGKWKKWKKGKAPSAVCKRGSQSWVAAGHDSSQAVQIRAEPDVLLLLHFRGFTTHLTLFCTRDMNN